MLGPAALGLGHDLLPVVVELFQQYLAVLVPHVHIVSYRDLGLRANIFRYRDLVSASYLYLQESALIPIWPNRIDQPSGSRLLQLLFALRDRGLVSFDSQAGDSFEVLSVPRDKGQFEG